MFKRNPENQVYLDPNTRRAKSFTLTLAIICLIYSTLYLMMTMVLIGRGGVDWSAMDLAADEIYAILNPPFLEVATTYVFTVIFVSMTFVLFRNHRILRRGGMVSRIPYYILFLVPAFNIFNNIVRQTTDGILADILIGLMVFLVVQALGRAERKDA